jgi:hypothetical protein
MVKGTLSMSLVIFPEAFIFSTIRPLLYSIAMTLVALPLTLVHSSILKNVFSLFLYL